MNTLKEKIKILEAMEKGSTIQYSETDGETDEWEDLKTSELDEAEDSQTLAYFYIENI